MNRNFQRALSAVLAHEGGYVNHPKDPGGATNLGVTLGTARRLGIDVDGDGDTDVVDIKLLKPTDAAKVYKAEYWDKLRGGELPSGVDYAVFDFAVNSGVSRAAIYLQDVLGVAPDGKIGALTIKAALQASDRKTIDALCGARMTFLKKLSTWPIFGKGWSSRVTGVLRLAQTMAATGPSAPADPNPPSTPAIPQQSRWMAFSAWLKAILKR